MQFVAAIWCLYVCSMLHWGPWGTTPHFFVCHICGNNKPETEPEMFFSTLFLLFLFCPRNIYSGFHKSDPHQPEFLGKFQIRDAVGSFMDAFSSFGLNFPVSAGFLNVVCVRHDWVFLPGYWEQTTAGSIDFITDLAKHLYHLTTFSADPLESS